MLRKSQVYQNPRENTPRDPKKDKLGPLLWLGAGIYILAQIKPNSDQSKPSLEQPKPKSDQSNERILLANRSALEVAPKPELSPSIGTGPANGSGKVLNYALLSGIGLGFGFELLRNVDFGKLLSLPLEPPPKVIPTSPPEQPPTVIPTLPPFHLNLPFTPTPITPFPCAGADAINAWTSPPDAEWLRLVRHPSVVLVLGKRGSGKSALGYRLLELLRNQAAPYVVGLPAAGRKLLPDWVGCADRLEDVPPKAAVLLDEAYLDYHARDSMSAKGRSIGELVNLSRQKEQTLIFIVQEARQLDVNVISQADVIAIKELSELSKEFERRELRRFTDKARLTFALTPGNKQPLTWVYSEAAGEVGLVKNELASFWKPGLSRAFVGDSSNHPVKLLPPRKGAKTPREVLVMRAKSLRNQGFSYGEIAGQLGIGKTTASDYVNEPDF